eukprot:TRINITY_DN3500_c0_g1_i2.p1 TRINITY_DN3500_c0_g1~~TRINITY_DN3500_c0_g1_i2.p1  ORF type:complete len:1156 (+),score=564.26 TRINITY_DN3500_c0_g1_i2:159-3470(+)
MRGDADKYRDAHKRSLLQLEQERAGHRKALDEAAQKVREAERRVQEAEDALHLSKADRQRLQDEVSSAETDLKILRSQRDSERKRLDDLLASSQDRMNAIKGTIAEHERKAELATAEAETLRAEAGDLRDAHERAQQTIIKLKQQIEHVRLQAQQEKNALQDVLDKKSSAYEDAINGKARYEALISRLQSELDTARTDLAKKEEARLKLAEQLEKDRDSMRASIDEGLKQSKEANARLQDEIDALTRQLNDARRTIRDLHEQMGDLKAEKDRQSASFNDELEQLRQANAEKVSELKRQIQRGEAKVQAAEMQSQRVGDQLKDVEDELERERQRYRQLQDQLDEERANHRKSTSDRVAELRQQIQELQDQLGQKDLDLADALRKADMVQLDLERAEKALRNKQADIDGIEAQHRRDKDNWATQLTQAEQALHKAQQEINDLKMQLDDALREADKQKALLRSALGDAEQNDLDKQRRLQLLKDRLDSAEETSAQQLVQILQLKGQLEDAQLEANDAMKQVQLKDAELKRWEERLKKYQNAGDQIAALQDEISALEDEVKKLKRDNDLLRQELAELQKRWDSAKERQGEDERTIADLRKKNQELQDQLSQERGTHDGALRKKNQELFAVQQELADALGKLQNLGKKALDAEETAEWKSKAEALAEQCASLQKELETCKAPLNAKISELRSELEKLSNDHSDHDELEALRKEHKDVCEKLRALIEQNKKDKLTIAELEDRVAELEALNRELDEKGRELEDRGKELSFLLGTRAQLVAQIMSLREAIKNSRQELMKVMREKGFKKAQTTMNMSGGGVTTVKIEKSMIEGVQNTVKKIDTSKKIVEDIVGKYFTGYEKLQHGSSSGHYNVSHDPNAGIFDAESGDIVKLAEESLTRCSPSSTPSKIGFQRGPGDGSQVFMIKNSRQELMKVMREKGFKKAQTTMNMSGGGVTTVKIEKSMIEGVQNTVKKIDTSKKIVEDIVGKYFTGYEKLQHGSSSGHYNVSHDPNAGIFDAESGDIVKLAEESLTRCSPSSTPSKIGFQRGPGDGSQVFMLASSHSMDPSSSPTVSPKQSPRLQQRPAQLKNVPRRSGTTTTPTVTPTSAKGSFRK